MHTLPVCRGQYVVNFQWNNWLEWISLAFRYLNTHTHTPHTPHTCTHSTHTHMHTCSHTHMHTCTHTQHTCTCTHTPHTCTRIHTHMHTYTHAHMLTHTHSTHTHAHMLTYTLNTHICTHTQHTCTHINHTTPAPSSGRSALVSVGSYGANVLLRLAIQAGFDWVSYVSTTYVKLSVTPDGEMM